METPRYAVIFSYTYGDNLDGYPEMDALTLELARNVPGYLGYESAKSEERNIFISYWSSKEAIEQWRKDGVHLQAKARAKDWYAWYNSLICEVQVAHFHTSDGKISLKH
jgi:heme-degrading monooxygenase HmoA